MNGVIHLNLQMYCSLRENHKQQIPLYIKGSRCITTNCTGGTVFRILPNSSCPNIEYFAHRHSVIIPATQYDIYNYSYSLQLIREFTASCYVLIAIKTIQGLAYQWLFRPHQFARIDIEVMWLTFALKSL